MTQYRPRLVIVEAVKYTGQLVKDLPAWLRDFQGHTTYGLQAVGRSGVGELLVPVGGQHVTIRNGDYIIYEADSKQIEVRKAADFEARYVEATPEDIAESEIAAAEAGDAAASEG